MAEGTEVGKAYVSLEATDAGLSSGLKQGEAKVEQFAANTTKATGRASKGFSGLGKGIKDTIKPLTTLVGGVTAAVGTFSLFVSLGERIGRTIFGLDAQGRTRQEAAVQESGDVAKALLMQASGLKPLDPKVEAEKERLDTILNQKRSQLQRMQEGNRVAGGPLGRQDTSKIEREILELEERRRMISGAELRLSRSRVDPARVVAPTGISGLGGGDPNAVLRELRAIRQEGMRRGSNE